MSVPRLAITMGDPAGIGPEVVLKALASPETTRRCHPVVVGHLHSLARDRSHARGLRLRAVEDAAAVRFEPGVIDVLEPAGLPAGDIPRGVVSPAAGRVAVACIRAAAELLREGSVAGMVTAPINKAAMQAAGHPYPGHTELLAEFFGVEDFSLVLTADDLFVFHVTTHVGLRQACGLVTRERVLATLRLAHRFVAAAGRDYPRIVVLGLNPHAGEQGLFGDEERAHIEPAVAEGRAEGIDVVGPLPGDTAMPRALKGGFDAVIAMYHDQGHIPFKAVHFDDGVNVTVGLPYVRTSVDHGTAFDIAGQGVARVESMLSAIALAAKLSPVWPDVTL